MTDETNKTGGEEAEDLAEDAVERAEIQAILTERLAGCEVVPTSVDFFQGMVPFQAWGQAGDQSWYFRFRSDHASLRVGPGPRDEDSGYVPDEIAKWASDRENVTGRPTSGSLSREAAIELIVGLWWDLVATGR